jgi:hypothetical protein
MEADSEAIRKNSGSDPEVWVSIREATHRLGISERAVRLRVKAGKLDRRVEDGRAQVRLPDRAADPEAIPQASESDRDARLADKDAEIAFLREQLQQHMTAQAELRTLMLADRQELIALRQRLALAPVQNAQKGGSETRTDAKDAGVSKQSWWRKLFARRG